MFRTAPRLRRTMSGLSLAAVLLAAGAGCGDDDSDGSDESGGSGESAASGDPVASDDYQIDPQSLTLPDSVLDGQMRRVKRKGFDPSNGQTIMVANYIGQGELMPGVRVSVNDLEFQPTVEDAKSEAEVAGGEVYAEGNLVCSAPEDGGGGDCEVILDHGTFSVYVTWSETDTDSPVYQMSLEQIAKLTLETLKQAQGGNATPAEPLPTDLQATSAELPEQAGAYRGMDEGDYSPQHGYEGQLTSRTYADPAADVPAYYAWVLPQTADQLPLDQSQDQGGFECGLDPTGAQTCVVPLSGGSLVVTASQYATDDTDELVRVTRLIAGGLA